MKHSKWTIFLLLPRCFQLVKLIRCCSNQFRLVCVWVCLMMKMQLADTAHFAQPKCSAAFRLSFVIYVPFNWHSHCSYFQYGWCLLMHFFLLNYDICVRHLCRFHFSNSFFFCRYFKKKSTLSCQHEHGAFVGFMNIWIFIYIFWLLFHPDLLDHQRICITFHRLHLRVEVSDGEVFLFPKVYIRCAPS